MWWHLSLALRKRGEEVPGCGRVGARRVGSPRGTGLLGSPLAAGPAESCRRLHREGWVLASSWQQLGQRKGAWSHHGGDAMCVLQLCCGSSALADKSEGDVRMRTRGEQEDLID